MIAVGQRVTVVRTCDDELDGFYLGQSGRVIGEHISGVQVWKVELDDQRVHAWFVAYELELEALR